MQKACALFSPQPRPVFLSASSGNLGMGGKFPASSPDLGLAYFVVIS